MSMPPLTKIIGETSSTKDLENRRTNAFEYSLTVCGSHRLLLDQSLDSSVVFVTWWRRRRSTDLHRDFSYLKRSLRPSSYSTVSIISTTKRSPAAPTKPFCYKAPLFIRTCCLVCSASRVVNLQVLVRCLPCLSIRCLLQKATEASFQWNPCAARLFTRRT